MAPSRFGLVDRFKHFSSPKGARPVSQVTTWSSARQKSEGRGMVPTILLRIKVHALENEKGLQTRKTRQVYSDTSSLRCN